jgi:hypothetical protein
MIFQIPFSEGACIGFWFELKVLKKVYKKIFFFNCEQQLEFVVCSL